MKKTLIISTLCAAAVIAVPAWAIENITIPDTMPDSNFPGGPVGVGGEDQETEFNTTATQAWGSRLPRLGPQPS